MLRKLFSSKKTQDNSLAAKRKTLEILSLRFYGLFPWTRSQGSEIHRVEIQMERYKIFQEKAQKSEEQDKTLKQGDSEA